MSIRVVCPNGHVLKVKNSFAGKSGLCPFCKAQVNVPELRVNLSEDDIMNVIGPHDPTQGSRSGIALGRAPSDSPPSESPSPPKKCCTCCNREIASGTHICPFCRTYIANLSDL